MFAAASGSAPLSPAISRITDTIYLSPLFGVLLLTNSPTTARGVTSKHESKCLESDLGL